MTNKISRIQKSKMAAAAILKIRKIAISLQWNDRLSQNFAQLWCHVISKIRMEPGVLHSIAVIVHASAQLLVEINFKQVALLWQRDRATARQ